MQSLMLTVVLGGAVAAVLDIGMAAMINKVDMRRVLRFIASGMLGHRAMTAAAAPYVGFVLQVSMGILITTIYAISSFWVPALSSRWMLGGLAYGVAIFFVMTYVVVPMSAAPRRPPTSLDVHGKEMLAMLVFGLIVAHSVHLATR